jgi:hypothetical protein
MPKIKYSATDANGLVHTRTSARVYTHMVAVRPSYDYAISRARRHGKNDASNFAENFAYYTQQIAQGGYYTTPQSWHTPESFAAENARHVERAIEALHGAATADEYAAIMIAKAVADVEAKKAEGYYDTLGSAGWCGRPDLADKLAAKERGEPWNAEVVILEAVAK